MKKNLLIAYRLAVTPILVAGALLFALAYLLAYGPAKAAAIVHELCDAVLRVA